MQQNSTSHAAILNFADIQSPISKWWNVTQSKAIRLKWISNQQSAAAHNSVLH